MGNLNIKYVLHCWVQTIWVFRVLKPKKRMRLFGNVVTAHIYSSIMLWMKEDLLIKKFGRAGCEKWYLSIWGFWLKASRRWKAIPWLILGVKNLFSGIFRKCKYFLTGEKLVNLEYHCKKLLNRVLKGVVKLDIFKSEEIKEKIN